jgi:hypothetical protein
MRSSLVDEICLVVRASDWQLPKSQQSWVRSQHPPTQWNLRGRQMKQHWIQYFGKKRIPPFIIPIGLYLPLCKQDMGEGGGGVYSESSVCITPKHGSEKVLSSCSLNLPHCIRDKLFSSYHLFCSSRGQILGRNWDKKAPLPPPPPAKVVCNVNIVYGTQKPQRNCRFMNSASGVKMEYTGCGGSKHGRCILKTGNHAGTSPPLFFSYFHSWGRYRVHGVAVIHNKEV